MRFACLSILMSTIVTLTTAPAQERSHARSMVITQRGIVATSQTLASQAGVEILRRGGSAIDAAIAANAVLGVVEPMSNGIGGDLFAIYRDAKTGELTGLNASGWSPRRLTPELLAERGLPVMPQDGILSATVPGCVDGWEKLHKRFGRLPWKELFVPAIYYAEHGFPVTEIIQGHWQDGFMKLSMSNYSRALFLPSGNAPKVGQLFRNPDLAKALRAVAEGGARGFYGESIARAILDTSGRLGGVFEPADLKEFESEWVQPISGSYRGWEIFELPPNSQGIAAIEMLHILEEFPLSLYTPMSAEAFHLKIEAQKLAYEDLQRYVGDPRFSRVPLSGLLSKGYAAQRAKLIDRGKANCEFKPGDPPGAGDTIYMTAIDSDGNLVSLIQSIYQSFGSGTVVDGMGFHLHNRAGLFTLEPGHPNVLAGRKRPFTTIIPAYMRKDNVHVGFGIMGGLNQAQAHAQFVSNFVDHGMNIQAALEAPRFTRLEFGGCGVMIEGRVPPEVRQALTRLGHQLDVRGDFSSWMGGGQAILLDTASGTRYGASSPRKDGAAIPEPDPYFNPQTQQPTSR